MKSHEQDLLTVCECILKDAYAKCTTSRLSFARDLVTVRSRTRHEGISFLTLSLPAYGQEFERALENKQVFPTSFPGWKKRRSLPAFLQGLIGLVFDAETGGILNEPDVAAVEGIRQLAYTFKKLLIPCRPDRESRAISGYIEIEHILSEATYPEAFELYDKVCRLLWGNVFPEPYDSWRYVPKHGPGQTAEGINGNRKYSQRTWYERLQSFFPADNYLLADIDQLEDVVDGIDSVQFVQPSDELPVKVRLVPKTLKGPRIIAMEPVCMQYAQQALASYFIKRLETSKLTAGHINFSDQTINQKLAIKASVDGLNATLDMSAASDRVPLLLVMRMLDIIPDYRDAVLACRSKVAQLPNGDLLPLYKFASMGSALCFPIESMYFFSVILTALFRKYELPVSYENVLKLSRMVYIYGDDIVVPVDVVDVVIETLTSFYCKVNSDKSFWKGNFRESCGMDSFNGEMVTPTYLRRLKPNDKGDVAELVSWNATSNLFYRRGYWCTASYLKDVVEAVLGKLPVIQSTSPGIGWESFQKGYHFGRWSRTLHRFEVLTYVATPVYQNDPLDGWSALLKFFLNAYYRIKSDYNVDEKHLSRSPRSGTFCMKRRWVPPY